jgi:plastocyanin
MIDPSYRPRPRSATRALLPSTLLAAGAAALLGVAALPSPAAHAGDVKGTLRAPEGYVPAPGADERKPYYWEEWNGFLDPRPRRVDMRRELAVVLLGPAQPGAENRATIALSGGSLSPSTIVVRPDTILRFENRDDFAHELFAEGLDGFSGEATSSGQARTVRVTQAGNWPIRDRQVPHVRGHLHVIANLAATATLEANGEYKFTNIAPGQYTVKVLHGANEVASATAQVADARELVIDPMVLTAPARAAAAAPR